MFCETIMKVRCFSKKIYWLIFVGNQIETIIYMENGKRIPTSSAKIFLLSTALYFLIFLTASILKLTYCKKNMMMEKCERCIKIQEL